MTEKMTQLLLKYEEAAALLGMSKQALIDRVYKGQGPKVVRIGRSVRFRPVDLEKWVEEWAMKSQQ